MQGEVVGGSLIQDVLKVVYDTEKRPGHINLREEKYDFLYKFLVGLIGLYLTIDPYITRND